MGGAEKPYGGPTPAGTTDASFSAYSQHNLINERRQPGVETWSAFFSNHSALPQCDEFVFGFSTGHVGTTTLSHSSTYEDGINQLSDVALFFELDGAAQWRKNNLRPSEARAIKALESVEAQERHVRERYLKQMAILLNGRRVKVCVDLSHFTMLYFTGLINVMRAERLPFRLVRIERDAVEVARSLGGRSVKIGYKPQMVGSESLVLRVPPTMDFSDLELGLFDVDETEAQWRLIDADAKRGSYSCWWSEFGTTHDNATGVDGGFIEQCVRPIAKLLGLRSKERVANSKDHHRREEDLLQRRLDVEALASYATRMRDASSAYRQAGASLPSGRALEARVADWLENA